MALDDIPHSFATSTASELVAPCHAPSLRTRCEPSIPQLLQAMCPRHVSRSVIVNMGCAVGMRGESGVGARGWVTGRGACSELERCTMFCFKPEMVVKLVGVSSKSSQPTCT